MRHEALTKESGFSLIELMVVIAIVILLAAFTIPRLARGNDATLVSAQAASRLRERHAAALRLNRVLEPTSLENYRQPPVLIDFLDPQSTRSLLTEGVDANNDGRDDNTGQTITRFLPPSTAGSTGTWSYQYRGSSFTLPTGWRVASSAADMGGIPLVGNGLGILTTRIGFDAKGTALGDVNRDGIYEVLPNHYQGVGTNYATIDLNREGYFWAIYLTDGTEARAIACHGSGLVESWRWDPDGRAWRGYSDRTVP